MWLPQSTHCSVHHRTRQCSDMTGHHIHPQHKAGHPAGKHPPRPGEHWGRTQLSTCLSLGHTYNCNIRSNDCFCIMVGMLKPFCFVIMNLSNQPQSQVDPSECPIPSKCNILMFALFNDVWVVTSGKDREPNWNLKANMAADGPERAGLISADTSCWIK